ncbi:hypothetical protein DFH07DRAFT_780632 [Mycena maculata]|uniref:DUF6533 domain-containing protein n=1 Tax=Mycena maculata TaxID=230809 RepID=A0AAD7MV15_9AGAR|nr:hypothetical protein DFH07DRAFT_780632 [Mycena maculata]
MEESGASTDSESMMARVSSALLLQQVKYMDVASMTILLFDYFLSLNLEVSLIWGSKWSFTKILYMCSRYSPFIDVPVVLAYELTVNINNKMYPRLTNTLGGTFFGIATAEAILVLRTYALMGCSARALTILVVQYVSLEFGLPPLSVIVGCHLVDGSIILVVAFICALFNETVLMICTLWVGVKRFRHSHNPLIKTLYRDGISYFVLLFLISAGNLAVLIWGPIELVDLFNTFLRVMHSVLSTRIVLHVREVNQRELQNGITSRDATSMGPKFRIPGTNLEYTIE